MRTLIALITSCLISSAACAAPGFLWEFGMEMEGMPFAMPKQKVCTPKGSKEPPVTKDDGDCRILEKKMTGNRFQWKAQCKDGLMLGDITSTPTSYAGSMKMTDKSGDGMSMKISGKRLGECDYQDRSGEIKAMVKQSEDVTKSICRQALDEMLGQQMETMCPKEKPLFCQRLATHEGYLKATRHLPDEMVNDPTLGASTLTKVCKLDNTKLLSKLCASAVSTSDFSFVSRLCPAERPKLCEKATNTLQLDYVARHCPSENAALIKQHCEGRRTSSDIDPRFASFCAGAAGTDYASNTSGSAKPDAAPDSGLIPKDMQEGIKKLRGMFGF
ncbi:MAG: DUF3617 family protein [Pseudomonadota bacterium]|nr:DUF3617 family protein [Pseudomonadota bacterium]